MGIKVGDLVLIEEGIYKGEKARVIKVLGDLVRLCVCGNGDDSNTFFMKPEYVTKVKNKYYSVQEIFDLAEEGDVFLDEDGYKYVYKNGTIYNYVNNDEITEYYYLGTIMKMKFFKVIEHSRLKINKKDLDNIVELLRDNGYNYEIEEV